MRKIWVNELEADGLVSYVCVYLHTCISTYRPLAENMSSENDIGCLKLFHILLQGLPLEYLWGNLNMDVSSHPQNMGRPEPDCGGISIVTVVIFIMVNVSNLRNEKASLRINVVPRKQYL
ncbi:hypothetical protein RHMOL_Rhmol13G0037100 [Rhododendron molle]|uniref:Uncharacterized protein n=1 Tax=Rhododendron molle TaxID=49168 RepID=A0ACC0L2J2_RHOML|nr:hypothetical protein RHMOL_Rhmol13G0037100 [Rhododendron molle]